MAQGSDPSDRGVENQGSDSSSAYGFQKGNRKKKKSSLVPLIFGLVMLSTIGFAVYLIFKPEFVKEIPFQYVPPNAEFIMAVRGEEIWRSGALEVVRENLVVSGYLDNLASTYSINPAEVEAIVIGATEVKSLNTKTGLPENIITVIKLLPERFHDRTVENLPSTQRESYKDFNIISPGQDAPSFFYPDDQTLVIGTVNVLKAAIDRKNIKPDFSQFDFIDMRSSFIFAFAPHTGTIAQTLEGEDVKNVYAKAIGSADKFGITAKVSDNVDVEATMIFKEKFQASDANKAILLEAKGVPMDGFIALLKLSETTRDAGELLETVRNGLTLRQDENTVVGGLVFSKEDIRNAAAVIEFMMTGKAPAKKKSDE